MAVHRKSEEIIAMEENKEEMMQKDDSAGEGRGEQYVERKRWLFFGLPFSFTK